jgi:hypothetical protein
MPRCDEYFFRAKRVGMRKEKMVQWRAMRFGKGLLFGFDGGWGLTNGKI